MSWQILSAIATIFSGFFVIFLKICANYYSISSVLSILFLFTFLFFYLIMPIFSKEKFKISNLNIFSFIEIYSVIAGISFGLASFFIINAIKYINNPGIPSTLVRGGVIFTYILSFILFKDKFKLQKFVGILIIIFSVLIETVNDLFNNTNSSSNMWILYTFLAAACSTIMDLVSKLSMKTINNVQLNIIAMLFAGITNASIQFAQERTFGLQKLKKT